MKIKQTNNNNWSESIIIALELTFYFQQCLSLHFRINLDI